MTHNSSTDNRAEPEADYLLQTRTGVLDNMMDDGLCRRDAEACLDHAIDIGVINEFVDGTVRVNGVLTALRVRARLWRANRIRQVKRSLGMSVTVPDGGWISHQDAPACLTDCPYADECMVAQQFSEEETE